MCCLIGCVGGLVACSTPSPDGASQEAAAAAIAPRDAAPEEPSAPFVDLAPDVGLDFVHDNGMAGDLYYSEMMGGGVALFDYDGDGDLDVYLVQGHALPSPASASGNEPLGPLGRLFRNELAAGASGDALRFTDVTSVSGLDVPGYGMGVVAFDYDGDGWQDLYVTQTGPNRLLRNRGDGTFEETAKAAGVALEQWSVPAVALDVDGDGWLDLFVGNYVEYSLATNKQCTDELGQPNYCGPLAYLPVADHLLRNRGDGTFEDISQASGIAALRGRCLGALGGDFNHDGRPDLYVANDGTANYLWVQQADGRFAEVALTAGVGVNGLGAPEASMGVAAADVDEDGDDDVILGHLARETNTLFVNQGNGTFVDLSTRSGLGPASLPFTTFGVSWLDFDNDGWLDLLTTNGAVKIIKEQALAGDPHPLRQRNQLFRNRGDGTFQEIVDGLDGHRETFDVSRGSAVGDLDNDGDSDVVVHNNGGPVQLLLNTVGQDQPWIGIEARQGRLVPPGVQVRLQLADGTWRYRHVHAGSGYASHDDARVLFGLGAGGGAQQLMIRWPDGHRETWPAPETGRYTIIQRGTGRPWTPSSPPEDES